MVVFYSDSTLTSQKDVPLLDFTKSFKEGNKCRVLVVSNKQFRPVSVIGSLV